MEETKTMFTTKEAINAIAELSETGDLFGIRTEIGTIVVQMLFRNVNWFQPVEVYRWKDAPRNDYIRECETEGRRYDFYVIFGSYKKPSEVYRYIYAAEIMSRIWMMKTNENTSDISMVDSKTYTYIKKHLRLGINQADLCYEMKRCLWGRKRIDPATDALVTYYVSKRVQEAKEKL